MMLSAKSVVVFALITVIYAGPASAVQSFGATPGEEAICRGRIPANSYAPHYCDCIRFRYRAIQSIGNSEAFRHNVNEALDGCDYALSRVSVSSAIRPKIHVDKGRALILLGRKAEAEREFVFALELNPAEVDAYVERAEIQRTSNRRADALETVTIGLRYEPASNLLKKMYLELGGKEPFPEPIVRSEFAGKAPLPEAPTPVEMGAPDTATTFPVDAQGSAEAGNDAAQDGTEKCRFCPPEEIVKRWRESFQPTR